MLLSDFDVMNMCGPSDVPEERAGEGFFLFFFFCECVFAWGVCRVWQASWKLSQPRVHVCLWGIRLGSGLGGAQFAVLLHHPNGSRSASQHCQNSNIRVRLFSEQVTRDTDDYTRCVITPHVFLKRREEVSGDQCKVIHERLSDVIIVPVLRMSNLFYKAFQF